MYICIYLIGRPERREDGNNHSNSNNSNSNCKSNQINKHHIHGNIINNTNHNNDNNMVPGRPERREANGLGIVWYQYNILYQVYRLVYHYPGVYMCYV